jgi:hypothetical protein
MRARTPTEGLDLRRHANSAVFLNVQRTDVGTRLGERECALPADTLPSPDHQR